MQVEDLEDGRLRLPGLFAHGAEEELKPAGPVLFQADIVQKRIIKVPVLLEIFAYIKQWVRKKLALIQKKR